MISEIVVVNFYTLRDPDGFEVEIYRYATEQTYDTRRWQILEHKARGIEQLRFGKVRAENLQAHRAAARKARRNAEPLPQQHSKHRALTAIPAARKPRKRQNRHHRRAEHPLNQRAAHAQRSFYPGQKPASNVSAAHRYCFLCQSPSPAFVGLWLHCMASRRASLSFFSANRGNRLTQ